MGTTALKLGNKMRQELDPRGGRGVEGRTPTQRHGGRAHCDGQQSRGSQTIGFPQTMAWSYLIGVVQM